MGCRAALLLCLLFVAAAGQGWNDSSPFTVQLGPISVDFDSMKALVGYRGSLRQIAVAASPSENLGVDQLHLNLVLKLESWMDSQGLQAHEFEGGFEQAAPVWQPRPQPATDLAGGVVSNGRPHHQNDY